MVEGVVNSRLEAVVDLTVRGPSGEVRGIEAVVDTGFTEHLVLTPELAKELRLAFGGIVTMVLANGVEEEFQFPDVTVIIDGVAKNVRVQVMGTIPLVGMALLKGQRLLVEVVEGDGLRLRRCDVSGL